MECEAKATEEDAALRAFIRLTRCAESVGARVHGQLKKKGITASQLGVLELLFNRGPLSQGVIGRKMIRSGGNMTLVIDNLEKRELVLRKRAAADRRHNVVSLTPKGRRLITGILPVHVQKIVEEMSALSVPEQEELERLCSKLGAASAPQEA